MARVGPRGVDLRWLALSAFLLLGAVAARGAAPVSSSPAERTVRLLFIGNSLTYYHEMPETFRRYSEAVYPGMKLVVESVATPGETLEGHWRKGEALQRIQAKPWDYVVLQEQGGLGRSLRIDGVSGFARPDSFFEYARRFSEEIKRVRARPVFYLTYAGPASPDKLTYLDYAYRSAAREAQAQLAPVGRAWERLRGSRSAQLYESDGHPSAQGSFLVAASIAQTLFGCAKPQPLEPLPEGVSAEMAEELQGAAFAECTASAQQGTAPLGPEPAWLMPPTLRAGDPLTPSALAGLWSAKESGLQLSLGSQLEVTLVEGKLQVRMLDYGVNAILPLELKAFSLEPNRIRFETEVNNRQYQIEAVLEGDKLHALVTQPRGAALVEFRNVYYTRGDGDGSFGRLAPLFGELDRQTAEGGLEPALVAHYQRLSTLLGADALRARIGQGFWDNEWLLILTGSDFVERRDFARGLPFLRLAVSRFPQSFQAQINLSDGLAAAERWEEANAAIEKAEALADRQDALLLRQIAERKEKLGVRLPKKAETH